VLVSACEKFTSSDCPGDEECAGAGSNNSSSGGSGPPPVHTGGAPSSAGGVAGGGEGNPLAMGGEANETVPQVTSVTVGGRKVDPDILLDGVDVDDEMVIEFNVPMKAAESQQAYVSDALVYEDDDVTFYWDDDFHLRVIPSPEAELPTVSDPETLIEPVSFTINTRAESRSGARLSENFTASFKLLRRVIQRWQVDMTRSASSLAYRSDTPQSGFHDQAVCPRNEYPDDWDGGAGKPGVVATSESNGSVALYSYPLRELGEVFKVEQATLTLAKWPWAGWEKEIEDYPDREAALLALSLRVDQVPGGPLNTGLSTVPPLEELVTTGGPFALGFGTFALDASGVVQEELEASTNGAGEILFRLSFNEGETEEAFLQTCASLIFDVTYLTK
jgi:hypothetical protein